MNVKNGIASSELVGEDAAEDAPRHRLQEREIEEAHVDREEAEPEAQRGQRERDRIADQHDQDEAAEHQRRHHAEGDHWTGFS